MEQPVQAGIISEITKKIKSISQALFNFIVKFDEYKINVTKQQQLDNDAVKIWCEYDNLPFGMIISPVFDKNNNKTDKVNILININNKDKKFENIRDTDVEKKVIDFLKSETGLDNEPAPTLVNSTQKIQVTLHKIKSSSSFDSIQLESVNTDLDSRSAQDILDSVLDDETFLSTLTNEPVSYEIADCGDNIEIETIDTVDLKDVFHKLISTAIELFGQFSDLMWNAQGESAENIRNLACNCRYQLLDDIDTFGMMSVEINDYIENPLTIYLNEYNKYSTDFDKICVYNETIDTKLNSIQESLTDYICSLDLYYADFSHDMQAKLDQSIRYWKETCDYYVKQYLK